MTGEPSTSDVDRCCRLQFVILVLIAVVVFILAVAPIVTPDPPAPGARDAIDLDAAIRIVRENTPRGDLHDAAAADAAGFVLARDVTARDPIPPFTSSAMCCRKSRAERMPTGLPDSSTTGRWRKPRSRWAGSISVSPTTRRHRSTR